MIRYPFDDSTSDEDFGPSLGSLIPLTGASRQSLGSSSNSSSNGSLGNGNGHASTGAIAPSPITAPAVTTTVPLEGGGASKWYWLDESAEEVIIRKKVSA